MDKIIIISVHVCIKLNFIFIYNNKKLLTTLTLRFKSSTDKIIFYTFYMHYIHYFF